MSTRRYRLMLAVWRCAGPAVPHHSPSAACFGICPTCDGPRCLGGRTGCGLCLACYEARLALLARLRRRRWRRVVGGWRRRFSMLLRGRDDLCSSVPTRCRACRLLSLSGGLPF